MLLTAAVFAPLGVMAQGISQLQQFTSTTSPASAITQTTFGKALRLTGQAAGCAQFSVNGTLTSSGTGCGGDFTYPFPSNATTTVLTLSNGANIPKLTNLTSNGLVKTSSGNGTLSVDTSTYLTTVDISANTNLSVTYPIFLTNDTLSLAFGTTTSNTWGGTQAFTNLITGSISGNAGTATALAANGTNCTAGNYPLGVDASGNSESCTAIGAGTSPYEIATTSSVAAPQLAYFTKASGRSTLGSVATTTLAFSSFPATLSGALGALVGGANSTLTWYGVSTSTALANTQIPYGTAANTIGSEASFSYAAATDLLSVINASTTALTASSFLQLPSSASQAPAIAGHIAFDTTDGQLKVGDGSATTVFSKYRYLTGLNATTTAWTATSSDNKVVAPFSGTLKDIQCSVPAGTLNVQVLVNSTKVLPMFNASSTVGTVAFTSANTFSRGDVIEFDYGTPASSPLSNSCSLRAIESST
ncbi:MULTISPECIES: hypothetical protein [unclassified Bradyrhizobium]|uniref:hypothetical protein n=1 Tax=unclassified Bradyrhizobium TaxID=2631580 RepID=UPI0010467412|nr:MULTISPECIES: hypothetical protein [unclassified Bradyrhizobium]